MEKRPLDISFVAKRWIGYKKEKDTKAEKPPVITDNTVKMKSSPLKRKSSSRQFDKNLKVHEKVSAGSKGNWSKVFAFSKFISLAKTQSEQEPANLVIGGRYAKLLIDTSINIFKNPINYYSRLLVYVKSWFSGTS